MQNDACCDVLLIEDLAQQRLPARTLAAVLRESGFVARLAHFGVGDDPEQITMLAQASQPRLIVLSILFAHLLAETLALVEQLRSAGVSAHLTMAGALPALAWEELLAMCPALDSVLCGEAEAHIVQLALRLSADWQRVPGLAYRNPAPCANPLPGSVLDLDTLPFPARDDHPKTLTGFGFATVEASRGCYHACTFCLPCAFYRVAASSPYRSRSVTHLIEEIDVLYRQGVRLFLFDDEQFLPPTSLRAERVAALAEQLRQRELDIAFTLKCRGDDVDETLFRQLRDIGLVRVYVGVESGCADTLKRLGKGVTAACNAQALAMLDALGIVADFRSLLFHPWSSLGTVQADIDFLERSLPHVSTPYTFHEVECYPGTKLAHRLRASQGDRGEIGCEEASPPGLRAYTLVDSKAELLRRLSRILFEGRSARQSVLGQAVRAGYELLLLRRFCPHRIAEGQYQAWRDITVRLNRESLSVWREMLAFADSSHRQDIDLITEHTSAWAMRLNICDAAAFEALARLIQRPSHPRP